MTKLNDELHNITAMLRQMGSLTEDAIGDSIAALTQRDNEIATDVIRQNARIQHTDMCIEEECVAAIALTQPVAVDLRFMMTAIKMSNSLARMGDLAVNICERAIELNDEPPLKPYIDIPRMARAAGEMLQNAIKAFENRDEKLARLVIYRDDEVDQLMTQVYNELLVYMTNDPSTISRATKVSYVAKYLERIADHAVNMATMVVYLVKGRIVRDIDGRLITC